MQFNKLSAFLVGKLESQSCGVIYISGVPGIGKSETGFTFIIVIIY
jgi:hypothetical protein